ncbi:MAG TPA: T9SS type A sorting domain-containing protein, partial [Bacteroidales bacterium]|nr:T9SS type A sorting domain-containing protein [Bacteroidales bacterium]
DTVYYTGTIGCHRFVIYDSGGDGLTTYYTIRSYINGVMKTIGNGSKFGYQEDKHFSVDSGVGVDEVNIEKSSVEIFPNPVLNISTVNFWLPEAGKATVDVYNSAGKQVMQLANNNYYNAGTNSITLNSSNLDNGIYFISIKTSDQALIKKFAVMK